MTLELQHAVPSTIADLIGQCVDAINDMASDVMPQVGKGYLEHLGVGSSPRIVFVPEVGSGKVEPPYELGNAARVFHSCNVFVRGRESGDDIDRFKNAYELSDLVIDLIQTAGTGRIDWGTYNDDSPTDTDAYGADIALTFTFRRDVPHSSIRWGLTAPLSDLTAQRPQPPPGVPADGITIDPATVPLQ